MQFHSVTLSAEQVESWLRTGEEPHRGRIQRFRHDASNPITPLILIAQITLLSPTEQLTRLQTAEEAALRVLNLVDVFCDDLRNALNNTLSEQDSGRGSQFLPITLSAQHVEEWLLVNSAGPGGRIQVFQHDIRNFMARSRNLASLARMQPSELAANLQKSGAAAEKAWELIRKFCDAVSEAFTAAPSNAVASSQ